MKLKLKLSLVALCLGTVLTGCSNQLEKTTVELNLIETSPAVVVDKIPEFSSVQTANYQVGHLRNPFFSETMQNIVKSIGERRVSVDLNRKRGPLEAFDISLFQMPGVFEKQGVLSALVQTPDGDVVVVKVGDYLGLNYGRITSINKSNIEVMEAIPDGLGGYLGQPVSLTVTEEQTVSN